MLRKKRKRHRRREQSSLEATASDRSRPPGPLWSWGATGDGTKLSRAELVLIRQAANQDWRTTRSIRRRVTRLICEQVNRLGPSPLTDADARWLLSVANTAAAIQGAKLRIIE